MSRRRRIYLLLALLPTTLGIATLAVVAGWPQTQAEDEVPVPAARRAAPPVELESAISLPPSAPAESSGSAPLVTEQESPRSREPASAPKPVEIEADEAAGPARFAGAGPIEPTYSPAPWSGGQIRLANLGGAGGGGPSKPKDGNGPGGNGPPGNADPPGNGPSDGENPGRNPDENPPGGTVPNDPPGQGDIDKPNDGNGDGNGDGGGGGNGGGTDWPPLNPDLKVPPVQVPEPSTIGLFVLGLLGCATRRKSRT